MNKNIKNSKALPLFYFTVIFAVIGMLLQACAVLFGYDPVMQVYKLGSKIGLASGIVLFIMSALYFVMSLYLMKGKRLTPFKNAKLVGNLISIILGCVMALASVIIFVESRKTGGTAASVSVMLCAVSIFAGLYFMFLPFEGRDKSLLNFLGFFPVIWAGLCLMRIYFDIGAAINNPIRVLFQISVVCILLSLMFELRLRAKKKCGGIAIAVTGIAIILSFSSVLSMMILYIIPKSASLSEMILSLCQLLISFYLLNRLYYNVK